MAMTTIHSSVSNYTVLRQREWRECLHQTVHMSSTFKLVSYHCLLPGKKCRSCMNSKLQHDSSMQNTPNLKCHKCWEILRYWKLQNSGSAPQKNSQRLSTHSRVSDKVGKHFCTSASAKHLNNFRMPKIGKSTSNLINLSVNQCKFPGSKDWFVWKLATCTVSWIKYHLPDSIGHMFCVPQFQTHPNIIAVVIMHIYIYIYIHMYMCMCVRARYNHAIYI